MEKELVFDLCIIGAGAAGLSIAAVATQLGLSVVIVEGDKMGGDCLNYGCVPSKSLLAAAHTANTCRNAEHFGIKNCQPEIDFSQVMAHVQKVIDTIAEHDSVQRFEKLGATVILETSKFLNKTTLLAGNKEITARHFIVAAGSSAFIPAIPGLENIPYLTNENIFLLKEQPKHLIIIGGGPIGCELAQAFLMLGTTVTILEAKQILPHDDTELVALLRQELITNGLRLHENADILAIDTAENEIRIHCKIHGKTEQILGSHVLVATGRRANVNSLNLEAAGVTYSEKGIAVNDYLQTSNRKIYAIGDITGGYQFTHIANYHAGIVIRNFLFRIPTKVNYRTLPWVTFTEPELAQLGLTEKIANNSHSAIKTLTASFSENDRAQTSHTILGKIKVLTDKKGYILGVSILGPHAGDLLTPWILAMQNNMKIKSLTSLIIPYPTLSEINKAVANSFYKDLLFSKFFKRWVRFFKIF